MGNRRNHGQETCDRLLHWTEHQKASERLAGVTLIHEGFVGLDPSHPLGGRDGGKDAICSKEGTSYTVAAYFPNGQKEFNSTLRKFLKDCESVEKNNSDGIIFFTNQHLSLTDRESLKSASPTKHVEIYHLERIGELLNTPSMYGVRLEFLSIEMTKEEQIGFFNSVANTHEELARIKLALEHRDKKLSEITSNLLETITGGKSYCYISMSKKQTEMHTGISVLQPVLVHCGTHALYDVNIDIVDVNDFRVNFNDNRKGFKAGNINPGMATTIPLSYRIEPESQDFNIWISARNGYYCQVIRMRYINGDWLQAHRLLGITGFAAGTVLEERIPDSFPDPQSLDN